jgi:outer membrane protein assembly factor BamB
VVIVRHTFPAGGSLLSFYGHLDPPSVTLREGTCVRRGDIVGQIGRPRTPPHLHFETRLHMPYATGGGYWPSDPTGAGWLPPSQTISRYRLQVAPGALWTSQAAASIPLGSLDETIFLMVREYRLVGIDLLTGDEAWSYELTARIRDALLDSARGVLYISDFGAGLLAYPLPTVAGDGSLPEELGPLWEYKLPASSRMDLMPLPAGGVLVSYRDTLSAFSPRGDLLWEEDTDAYLNAWALAEDMLLFTTSDDQTPLMGADAEGLYTWDHNLPGIPLVAGQQAWLYAERGLYRLDLAARSVQRLYDLPTARMRRSAALPLSDSGLVLLHTDTADRRLLVFDPGGELRWEFSVPLDGDPQLFELDGTIYLLTRPSYAGRGSYWTVEVFAVDLEAERLLRVFENGSRTFNTRDTWAIDLNERKLLIHIGAVGTVLFDPEAAQKRMAP